MTNISRPVILPYILKTIWCMYIILSEYESVWPDVRPKNKCGSLWHIFHGPVIVPYTLKTISCMNNIFFFIMNQYDPTHDLKINIGHHDLYFTVQWFCLISWWLLMYESVRPDIWPQNKCRSLWHIFHGPLIVPYLDGYFIYEHHCLGLWISMTRCITSSCGSSIGSEFAWHASGHKFDPHVRHILSWRLGHENISSAILPLSLIQKSSCQLLAKECALSTGKLPRRLVQEQCG